MSKDMISFVCETTFIDNGEMRLIGKLTKFLSYMSITVLLGEMTATFTNDSPILIHELISSNDKYTMRLFDKMLEYLKSLPVRDVPISLLIKKPKGKNTFLAKYSRRYLQKFALRY
uniref:Uncharacterized protein n=1 Tax=Pithovirus LCDPAC01 TaxID=2506600 RepID=A0A481YN24_9VIRU|nr:MAG: hypothetical protein LCDPAC01_00070 [Pithovirus LCDPAC01]